VILMGLAALALSTRDARAEAGMVLVDATIDTGGCAVSSSCPCGYFCVSGRCRWNPSPPPSCTSDRDCQTSCSGLLCLGGSCVAPDGGITTDVGVDGPTDADGSSVDVHAVIDVVAQDDTGRGPAQDAALDTDVRAVDPADKGCGCSVQPTRTPLTGLLSLLSIVGASLARRRRGSRHDPHQPVTTACSRPLRPM
jgi:MYXO-CTERM domain-containing protein